MATLTELHTLFFDEPLRNKVQAALFIIGAEILNGNDTGAPYDQAAGMHTSRAQWAAAMLQTADALGPVMRLVLGANAAATVVQIQAATDAAILDAIRAVVGELAGAFVA